jgi:short-subunit dehydrogenase
MTNFKKKYGNWALITGASSGIGYEFALIAAKRKLNVVLVARREDLLNKLKSRLEDEFSIEVKTIALDLLTPNAVKSLAEQTKDLDIGLVIPNAGIEISGSFIDATLEENERVVNLNTLVPMQIANVFGRRLAKRGRGGILFVSSLFGYQGIPLFSNYAATKAYILSLGEALNVELAPYGVDVTVLSPGLTNTAMAAGIPVDFNKIPVPNSDPHKVALDGINSLGKKATIVSGMVNKFYAWQNRFIPRSFPVKLFSILIGRAFKKDYRSTSATTVS